MARACQVCAHEDVYTINERLVGIGGKSSNRSIAKQYGLDHNAVQRHREHIPQLLVKASRAEEILEGDRLLDRLLEHLERGYDLERRAREEGILPEISAHNSVRGDLEKLGEAVGQLNKQVYVGLVINSPTWIKLETTIVDALEQYPEARAAVMRALENAERKELGSG